MLAIVGEVMGLLELRELSAQLLRTLREAVPADWCAINEVPADPPNAVSITDPPVAPEVHAAFARLGLENPLVQNYLATGDGRATRFSDLITRRELHQLDLYRELYAPLGIEYQIAFTLPSRSAQRLLGISLSRSRRDFTAAERALLNLARPYLIQAYRNALAYTRLEQGAGGRIVTRDLRGLGLTQRQAEVLRLVAMGHSDQGTAAALGIGVRTAQKHLELCYRTLKVANRSEAAQVAWTAARD